jgi:hypothetical protein
MSLKKTEQETEAQRLSNQMKPFMFTPFGNVVFLKDGRMILQGDYDAAMRRGEKLETMAAPANAADVATKFAEEQMRKKRGIDQNAPAAPDPAAPAAPAAAAPAPVTPPKTAIEAKPLSAPSDGAPTEQKATQQNYDATSQELAKSERKIALNGGVEATTAKNISDKYVGTVVPMATAARDSTRYLGELASNLSEAAQGRQ